MKHSLTLSFIIAILFTLQSCGDSATTTDKTPNNSPEIRTKKSASVHKPFGRGISYKIATFQQYFEAGGKKPEKHLITISKPSAGRELKLSLPLDMERIKKFRRIDASKFEGAGPIPLDTEHLYKDHNQKAFWRFQEDGSSSDVFLQEGTYSFILQNDFEMIHIYDSKNDLEYMEMKM